MLEDSPLIEDIDSSLKYCRSAIEELKNLKNLSVHVDTLTWVTRGIQHTERLCVDSLMRCLKVISFDIDEIKIESDMDVIDSLSNKTEKRPAFISFQTKQFFIFINNLSLIAGLPITRDKNDAEKEYINERKSAKAFVRSMEYLIRDVENMRTWCLENLE